MNNKATLSPEVTKLIENHIDEIQANDYKKLILDAVKEGRKVFFELRDALRAAEEHLTDENKKTMSNGFDAELVKLLLTYGEIVKLVK